MRTSVPAAFLFVFVALSPPGTAEDLAKVYPATLGDYDPDDVQVLEWTCTPEDVWEVRSFDFEFHEELEVSTGPAQVVFGRQGSNVVWAAVFPERRTRIECATQGDGETIEHVFLRFHPSRVGELFPERSVRGRGEPDMRFFGIRVALYKQSAHWESGGRPILMDRSDVILDVDTTDGRDRLRRAYSIDFARNRLRYLSPWVTFALPELEPTSKREGPGLLESAWKAVEREYGRAALAPERDWESLVDDAVERASRADTTFELGILLRELLSHYDDPGVWVKVDDDVLPGFGDREIELNVDFAGVSAIMGDMRREGEGPLYARSPHGIGYVRLLRSDEEEHLDYFDETLARLSDTWAIVLDLRYHPKGEKDVVESIAGRFVSEPRTYAFVQHARDGELGVKEEVVVEPRGDWQYSGQVHVVVGQGTRGAGERMMLALARADRSTSWGERTFGASMSSDWCSSDGGLSVYLPMAIDYDSEGEIFYGEGCEPDNVVAVDPDEITEDMDPLLYQVLEEILRTPAAERTPGGPEPVEDDASEDGPEEDSAD